MSRRSRVASDQKTTLANRHVDPEERSIALYQAARYSQYCRVFAFSTFDGPVPPNSLFGRTTVSGEHVLCVDPAALRGRRPQPLDPVLPSAPFAPGTLIAAGIQLLGITQPHPATVWSSLPGAYAARCSGAGGAHVLQITPRCGAQLPRPRPDPTWGLHLLDANVVLGNLVNIVNFETQNWLDERYSH